MNTRWRRAKGIIDTTNQLSRKADEKFDPERKDATNEPPDNVSSGPIQPYGVQPMGQSYAGNPNPGSYMYGNPGFPTNNPSGLPEQLPNRYPQTSPSYWQSQSPYPYETHNQQSAYHAQQPYIHSPPLSGSISRPSFESSHPSTHQGYDSTYFSTPGSSPQQYPMSSPISQYSNYPDTHNSFTAISKSPERALTLSAQPNESPKLATRTWTAPATYTDNKRCARHGGGYTSCDESQCQVCNNPWA